MAFLWSIKAWIDLLSLLAPRRTSCLYPHGILACYPRTCLVCRYIYHGSLGYRASFFLQAQRESTSDEPGSVLDWRTPK